MRIEEGKYYRTRDGRKVGPIEPWTHTINWKWQGTEPGKGYSYLWDANGVNYDGEGSPHDLVAEWSDGPVRTITRQEIIPGTYDGVVVMGVDPGGELYVSLIPMATRDPDRLERAAAVLTALAGALRDGK